MKRLATLTAAAALCAATISPAPAFALSDDERAALAALLIIGVGVAAVAHGNDHNSRSNWDHERHGEPFSPSAGVTCLPKPRQCYRNGMISRRWTQRIYG